MRIRKIAILIDGGFYLKRLPHVIGKDKSETPQAVAKWVRTMSKRHVWRLTHAGNEAQKKAWLDHVYRIFYYDARPYANLEHHPMLNRQIKFAETDEAIFRNALFDEIRKSRKFALRLGHLQKEGDWRLKNPKHAKKLLRTMNHLDVLENALSDQTAEDQSVTLTPEKIRELRSVINDWKLIKPDDVVLGLRQKGVDMRMGIDISTLTLKKQVDTIVLVTGDSDFVPAAKLARREGVEFILDPMGQQIKEDLNEHVDGVTGVLRPPKATEESPTQRPDDNSQPVTGN